MSRLILKIAKQVLAQILMLLFSLQLNIEDNWSRAVI